MKDDDHRGRIRYDPLSVIERGERMRRVRAKDTKPELTIRKLVFSMGYRYRLHRRDLQGAPDLVFAGRQKIIFVHGCFWHLHNCGSYKIPKTRTDYWLPKLKKNAQRDRKNTEILKAKGWDVLVIWECQLKDLPFLATRIKNFLEGATN